VLAASISSVQRDTLPVTGTLTMILVHLCATNDRNGNPRRAYAAYLPDGTFVGAWDEGYYGSRAVPDHIRAQVTGELSFSVPYSEVCEVLRMAKQPSSTR
jgi:hypothetical protein